MANSSLNTGGPVASVRSLLNWLKTFEVPEASCSELEELSSGNGLLKCLESVMPGAVCSTSSSPWEELWRVMEEFCQCSLERFINVSEIMSGNEEHIARAVVLLLCITAVGKNNHQIIERIKTLDDPDQRNIMFYIQRTMGGISSQAIANGDMTSGVNEALPDLEDHVSPTSLSQPSSPVNPPTPSTSSLRPQMLTYSTPRQPTQPNSSLRADQVSGGHGSPCARKKFITPAIVKPIHPLSKAQMIGSPVLYTPKPTPFKLSAEVPRLRHRVSVLEGMVETHRKNADEYYSELCSKSKDYDALMAERNQLSEKVAHLEELRDVQDELDQAKLNLSKVEKSLERAQSENTTLRGFKERVKELEVKLDDYDLTHTKLHEYKERVDKLSVSLVEKKSELNELTVAHKTVRGQLEAKTTEMENLIQQNREVSRELKEMIQNCRSLEEEKAELASLVEKKAESEQCLITESKELKAQVVDMRGELSASNRQVEELTEQLQSVESDYASYKTHLDGTLQDTQKEMESLKVKLSMKEGEIENETAEKLALAEKVAQLEDERQQLSVVLKKAQENTKETISSLLQEKESELMTKDSEMTALSATKKELEGGVAQLQNELTQVIERCEMKEAALADCRSELSEKGELVMTLSSEKIELLEKLDQLQSNLDGMNTKYNCLVQDIDNLRQENASIERELDLLIAKNNKTEKESAQVKSANRDLTDRLVKLEDEIEDDKKSSAHKDSTISSLSADKADLEQQVTHLQAERDRLSEELEATTLELKGQLATKDGTAKDLEERNASLMRELEELQASKGDLEAQMAELEDALSEKDKEMDSLMTSAKTDLEMKIAELEEGLQAKEREIEQYIVSSDACESKLNTMKGVVSSLESDKRGLEEEVVKLQSDSAKLREELQAKDAETEQHVASLDEYKSRLSTMEGLVSSHESEKQSHSEEIATLESKGAELEKQLHAKEKEIEESLSSLQSCKDQLNTVNCLVSSLEAEKEALNDKLSELEESYKRKQEEDEVRIGQCHEVLVGLKSEIEQLKKNLEERNQENTSLKASLAKSKEEATAIREKSEESRTQFTEEKKSMKEEILKLEQRLEQQLQESRAQYQKISTEMAMTQQKYASELDRLTEENRSLYMRQEKLYNQLREDNIETLRKQNKFFEEVDKVREREREMTELCKEYKDALERERERALSANNDNKTLQEKIQHLEQQREKEVGQLQEQLERLSREQRQAAAKENSLVAQLSYASEKLRAMERSNQISPPHSRPSSHHFRHDSLIGRMSVSTISGHKPEETRSSFEWGSQIGGGDDHSHTGMDDPLTFKSSSSSLRSTLEGSNADNRDDTLSRPSKDEHRILELQRRNATYLPHLKSSYPIETQTQRESPSVCDEQIKNGSKHIKASMLQEIVASSSQQNPTAFELSLDPVLSSTIIGGERKRVREKDPMTDTTTTVRSPAPKSRRLGEVSRQQPSPLTKRYGRTFSVESQQPSMRTGGLKLREYLDKEGTRGGGALDKGTSFMVSPPKGKGKGRLPKRLQENLVKREEEKKKKERESRREPVIKIKKVKGGSTSKRNALKTKN